MSNRKPKYTLEILEPGSDMKVGGYFESSQPFMAINVGDTICSEVWDREYREELHVTKVEHIIWGVEDPHHKIVVSTVAVSRSATLKLAQE